MTESFDGVVLGAGEAGTIVASLAIEAGRRVALVYRAPFGSTCLNTGCVPSKFLIHRARAGPRRAHGWAVPRPRGSAARGPASNYLSRAHGVAAITLELGDHP